MTERFTLKYINEQHISANLYDNGTFIGSIGMGERLIALLLNFLNDENEQLKRQMHLLHMSSMFSTVKSFKGDISKRYKYSEETDTIYDTANNYGQYDKILNKKEITMLLNEYNTFYEELKND